MGRFWRWTGARLVQVIFGGTFDPVHSGHLAMLSAVCETFSEALVRVMPNGDPPHRQVNASASQRVEMLRLAMPAHPRVILDTREVGSAGPRYTVDTLAAMRDEYGPDESLVFCLGRDAAAGLLSWGHPERVLDFANLCIMHRAGHLELPAEVSALWSHTYVSENALCTAPFGRVCELKTPDVPVSSTQVRALVAAGQFPLPVPTVIGDYIREHGLYLDTE